ncbi:hypothetical protein HELRODRAFT_166568 [Helobdella robusta]|uniref:Uncharacterized protein n=1 Tax=Helobdella robusta TaxID=6412 RepID=T1EY94_HELRO|nr:hypothetical protein HELRODRAFT_166568 [Helobdella robusta]ESO11563.1 hypothetical protein HELRODRAFT_166568 [Helobdella robusta]
MTNMYNIYTCISKIYGKDLKNPYSLLINEIDGLYALKSETSILVIGSNDFNVYRLSDHMSKKGWSLSPLQYPTLIHIAITLIHTKEGVADRFIRDVTECTREIMKVKVTKDTGTAAIYGMAHSVPDVSLVAEVTGSYFDAYYSTQVSQKSISTNNIED